MRLFPEEQGETKIADSACLVFNMGKSPEPFCLTEHLDTLVTLDSAKHFHVVHCDAATATVQESLSAVSWW